MITNILNSARRPGDFPILSRIVRREEEFVALARQGFIRAEKRRKKTIWRLRYRFGGRQRVRYVSPRDVEALEAELSELQSRIRARRRLTRLSEQARQALRHRRSTIAPLLEASGYKFHGNQIRRRRSVKVNLPFFSQSHTE
jgi:hypothetical protein